MEAFATNLNIDLISYDNDDPMLNNYAIPLFYHDDHYKALVDPFFNSCLEEEGLLIAVDVGLAVAPDDGNCGFHSLGAGAQAADNFGVVVP